MATQDCPLPNVAEALSPYIKSRAEATQIRSNLHRHLQRQTGHGDAAISSVHLVSPAAVPVQQTPNGITGVRKAYLTALRAHSAAQARYDALRADLAQLSEGLSSTVSLNGNASVSDSHIPLLRQREKHRRLQVIERTYSEIVAAGKDSIDGHLDDVVKQQAGDLPVPPTSQPASFGDRPDIEGSILQLKKAVLSTKRAVVAHQSASADGEDISHNSVGGETAGLQNALAELTGWMEQQLAAIGDGSSEEQPPNTPAANGDGVNDNASLEDIAALYDGYLAAREKLIQAVTEPPSSDLQTTVSPFSTTTNGAASTRTQHASPAEAVLPYVSSLTSAKDEERSLQQQSSFLRRQIAASESETHRLLARLADESHLVHPGASKGSDWATAAMEASRATEEYAMPRLKAGEEFAAAARKDMEEAKKVPQTLESVARAVS